MPLLLWRRSSRLLVLLEFHAKYDYRVTPITATASRQLLADPQSDLSWTCMTHIDGHRVRERLNSSQKKVAPTQNLETNDGCPLRGSLLLPSRK
jgi:hypothetical protein